MPNWKSYEATVRLLSAIIAAHPDLKLNYNAISELMGSEIPASYIQSQHRETFKPLAERLVAMRDAGMDCKNVDLTGLGSRRYKAATAEKFGDGTTGASGKKPRAPRTPSKKAKKAAAASSEEVNADDDSDMEIVTPSKKSSPVKKETLNKVKGGRVEKKNTTPGRAAKNGVKSYVDSDDETEDGDETIIKDEDLDAMDFGRAVDGDEDMLGGGGFSGHGHRNGKGGVVGNGAQHDDDDDDDDDEEEDQFYDDES